MNWEVFTICKFSVPQLIAYQCLTTISESCVRIGTPLALTRLTDNLNKDDSNNS